MRRLVKILSIVLFGAPASLLCLWGLSLVTIVGPQTEYEAQPWVVYGMGAIGLSLAAVFFTLMWVSLRALVVEPVSSSSTKGNALMQGRG